VRPGVTKAQISNRMTGMARATPVMRASWIRTPKASPTVVWMSSAPCSGKGSRRSAMIGSARKKPATPARAMAIAMMMMRRRSSSRCSRRLIVASSPIIGAGAATHRA
jgi:hypothetical protein